MTMIRTIEVLDRSGHLSLTWDPSIPESVERAKGDFEKLRAAGYEFFSVADPDEATGFAASDGVLIVKARVDASSVAPVVVQPTATTPEPPARRRRGRPPKNPSPTNPSEPKQERTVAIRPMRGG
jgi:hypothetical protein